MRPELRERLQSSLGSAYHLERELAGGGHACVYVARDVAHDRLVVVKVLAPDLAGAVDVDRFRREIRIAGALSHPNIVPVLDSGSRDGVLYFTMPLAADESLEQVLARERQLPVDQAVRIAADVAEALVVAHRENVLHRDIKPANILLVPQKEGGSRAMVTDFGIARAIERSAVPVDWVTSTGLTLGTPLYMSPEQASGERDLDGRSDVYSLGCVLYEMLAGEPPFTGPTALSIIARHINEAPRSLRVIRPELPETVEQLISTALAKVPADRFPDAKAMLAALRDPALLRSRSTSAPPPRPARRRPRWWPGIAGGILLGTALGLLMTRPGGQVTATDGGAVTPALSGAAPIAVLPFEPPAGDERLAELARGLTRDLVDALSGVPGLVVLPGDGPAPDARAETLVRGSVEALGDSLRVTLRLVDSAGVQRGLVRVEERRSQTLEIRDEIVRRAAEELRRVLGGVVQLREWRAGTRSEDAWILRQRAADLHLAGRRLLNGGSDSAAFAMIGAADSLLAVAAIADPAWSELPIARGWLTALRAVRADSAGQVRWLGRGIAFADEALLDAPGDARALELRGVLRYRLWRHVYGGRDERLADSVQHDLLAATTADPRRARAWNTLGVFLSAQGDHAGAVTAARAAIAADTYLRDLAPSIQLLVFAHLQAERYDSARTLCDEGARRLPESPELRSCALSVLGWSGRGQEDVKQVWRELRAAEEGRARAGLGAEWPTGRAFAAAVLARTGMTDSARAVLRRTSDGLGDARGETDWMLHEAWVRALLGERDASLALLERAVARDHALRPWIATVPWYRALHDEPRFRRLVATRD